MADKSRITLVGAGLVGSLWALILRRRGFEVEVFEKRPDPRRQGLTGGRSINLVITSRGLKGLEIAGLSAKARELAVAVKGRLMHAKTGDTVFQAYGQEGEFNLSISRGELNAFLISEAEKAGVKFQFEASLLDLDPERRTAVFQTPNSMKSVSFGLLFGADGAGSQVRRQLVEKYPSEHQESVQWLEADYKELSLPLKNDGTPALQTDALHIWPRGAHMMMALANRDGSFTVTLYLPKTGRQVAFDLIQDDNDVLNLFETEFPDALPLMPQAVSEFRQNPQGQLGTVRLSKWIHGHSVALIGDAAHAIVPFFGQGMNSAFEDAVELDRLLDQHGDRWDLILPEYDRRRRPNANAIADMALENWVEMKDKVADPRFLLRKKVEGLLEQKNPGVYKSRYGLITYTLTPYALAQEAGRLQDEILARLIEGRQQPEEISWSEADELLQNRWVPFIKEKGLDLATYKGG